MTEEKLREIVLIELKKSDRPSNANEFLHRVWLAGGWNFNDPDDRQQMPLHETVSRIARDLRNNPDIDLSKKEQDRREELQKQYRLKYGGRVNETLNNMKKF